jgi:hypothetical protein
VPQFAVCALDSARYSAGAFNAAVFALRCACAVWKKAREFAGVFPDNARLGVSPVARCQRRYFTVNDLLWTDGTDCDLPIGGAHAPVVWGLLGNVAKAAALTRHAQNNCGVGAPLNLRKERARCERLLDAALDALVLACSLFEVPGILPELGWKAYTEPGDKESDWQRWKRTQLHQHGSALS